MLVRTVAMLTKLLERLDPEQFRVRESPSDPILPFEHEHDDEHLVAASPHCGLHRKFRIRHPLYATIVGTGGQKQASLGSIAGFLRPRRFNEGAADPDSGQSDFPIDL